MEIEVVAWDGEGFDEGNWHRYALLACGVGTEEGPIIMGPELRERNGLRSMQLLKLIWDVASARPYAVNVMYGAGYDWDNWIKDVDLETARAIRAGHPVRIGPWTVRNNGIWFELGMGHGSSFRRITVWDMWKFWGTGFERALRETFPDFHGLGVIKQFKEVRGRFTWEMMDEVAHYNRLELEGLIMLTRQFFDDLGVAGVPAPSFLTGAGALAGALDRKYGIPAHVGDQHFDSPMVEDAVLRAFSAGRIEAWQIGHVPEVFGPSGKREVTIWQHDRISAYPTAMLDLPSMAEGSWEWVDGPAVSEDWVDRMSVFLVRWDYVSKPGPTTRYYPFFYRTPQGNILYPPDGLGWQWWPEVVTARQLGWKFKVLGAWRWRVAERLADVRPYAWVPMLYAQRAQLKAAGKEGAQRVLKYGLNALYGKMVQARGAVYGHPPANQNFAWGGWVTSHCRAQIMWAAHQNPEAVLYQMTDSVVSLEQLDVPVGKGLGYWEVEERVRAVIAQAGVGSTWCNGCKEHPDGGEHAKYRGFDPETITADTILEAWEANHYAGWQHPVTCEVRRPVTLAEAVLSEERWVEFGNWLDQDRELDVYGGGGKRLALGWEAWRPWERPYPLTPAIWVGDDPGHVPISARYEPAWATDDPWNLPEVMGRLRRREQQAQEA